MKKTPKFSESGHSQDWGYQAVFLIVSLAVIALATVLEVRDQRVVFPFFGFRLPESCWFKRLTGLGCPGCGLTRSIICLVHGNFLRAWDFNPGGYFFFLLIAAQLPYRIVQIWRIHRGFAPWCLTNATLGAASLAALALLVQWIVRWWGNAT
ncbi:MAG: DUF2752 domain-containing protein [Pirellulaceae bacterium]|jgi:hypothetical protein|nr:DUF2752 domain-containing protein [Pirellulaceae bacterium]MCU0980517.1 DUF2752 domain-containing protein [Pirellulaceae bacterium]